LEIYGPNGISQFLYDLFQVGKAFVSTILSIHIFINLLSIIIFSLVILGDICFNPITSQLGWHLMSISIILGICNYFIPTTNE